MKKLLLLSLLISIASGIKAQDTEGFENSSCYQEYQEVYAKTVQKSVEDLERRRDIAFSYGVIINEQPKSDWGKSEKEIANAAYLNPSTDTSRGLGMFELNAFNYIHSELLKKHPDASPYKTRDLIRRGFVDGNFCKKFLFFKSRKGKAGVSRYVISEYEKDLESGAIPLSHISDSEVSKDEMIKGESDSESEEGSSGQKQ